MPSAGQQVKFKFGTQAAFNSATKNDNTIYITTDTQQMYVGNKLIGAVDVSSKMDKFGEYDADTGAITPDNGELYVEGKAFIYETDHALEVADSVTALTGYVSDELNTIVSVGPDFLRIRLPYTTTIGASGIPGKGLDISSKGLMITLGDAKYNSVTGYLESQYGEYAFGTAAFSDAVPPDGSTYNITQKNLYKSVGSNTYIDQAGYRGELVVRYVDMFKVLQNEFPSVIADAVSASVDVTTEGAVSVASDSIIGYSSSSFIALSPDTDYDINLGFNFRIAQETNARLFMRTYQTTSNDIVPSGAATGDKLYILGAITNDQFHTASSNMLVAAASLGSVAQTSPAVYYNYGKVISAVSSGGTTTYTIMFYQGRYWEKSGASGIKIVC